MNNNTPITESSRAFRLLRKRLTDLEAQQATAALTAPPWYLIGQLSERIRDLEQRVKKLEEKRQ